MINKLLYIFIISIVNIMISSSTFAAEVFNFDVTEVEIIEEGNKFIGKKGGTATSDDGTVIKANNFEYDKLKNILIAIGDVEIDDKKEWLKYDDKLYGELSRRIMDEMKNIK